MTEYDEFEREIIDHFKKQYKSRVGETADEDIYWMMVEHRYGNRVRDPQLTVDWNKVFNENQCPACNDIISLSDEQYICNKCGFAVPVKLYDEATKQYKNRQEIIEEDKKIRDKIKKRGLRDNRVKLLFNTAVEEARRELRIEHDR